MLLLPLFALFAIPFCLAATKNQQEEFVKLSKAGNGIIKLDERLFDLLTAPTRDWSVTVVFSALDPRRKCGPCK
jgi:oligosaccharyltransferase complex subunit gamma